MARCFLDDFVLAISERLKSYVDYVRFRAVCVSWNSIVPKSPTNLLKQPMPMLMLPFDDEGKTTRSFYSIVEDKVYHLELPETRGKYFRGSSDGWVVTVEKGPGLHLFNPLTKAQISLPPLSSFPSVKNYCPDMHGNEYAIVNIHGDIFDWSHTDLRDMFIRKLVISSSPTSDNYLAVAIYCEYSQLAYCGGNDNKWTAANIVTGGFLDVICFEGRVYALNQREIVVGNVHCLPLNFTPLPIKLPRFFWGHLVGSSDGLMLVTRWLSEGDRDCWFYKTIKFEIYKLESNKGDLKWSKIVSLGDNVIFIGYNASLLMSVKHFPQLKGNCVYYTDNILDYHSPDHDYGGFDIGMFDMEEGCIHEFSGLSLDSKFVWPPPIWVMPNLLD